MSKKTSTINLFGFETLKLKIRRLKLWKPTVVLVLLALLLLAIVSTVTIIIQEGTGSVRFVSVPDFSKIYQFGSVRFGHLHFPVRRGSACAFRPRRGSVRFGSVRFRVLFRLRSVSIISIFEFSI